MLKNKKIENIKNVIIKYYKPNKVILFGSYANGPINTDSDLDLLIVKKTNSSFYKRVSKVRKILNKYNYPFDILVYTPEEVDKWINVKQSFISQIFKTGKLLYG